MSKEEETNVTRKDEFDWALVLWYLHLYFLSIFGIWVLFDVQWMTLLFGIFLTATGWIGVTVGAHRYYAHRTFEAAWPLRYFFVVAHTLAGVGPLYDWILRHRIHHKYYMTDKDPYRTDKGFVQSFFISNIMKSPPDYMETAKSIDMRDVDADVFVLAQQKLYWFFFILLTLLIPIYIPALYWNEEFLNTVLISGVLRLFILTNISNLVNSAVLVWGLKPRDKFPIDDNSVFYVSKSYWPNYHYLLPWDWKSSEFGQYGRGLGTMLIKMWKELGLVTMTLSVSSKDVRRVLHDVAKKKTSFNEGIEELQQLSKVKALYEMLQFEH